MIRHLMTLLVLVAGLTATPARAMDDVIGECHKVPGSVFSLGKTLAGHALKASAGS